MTFSHRRSFLVGVLAGLVAVCLVGWSAGGGLDYSWLTTLPSGTAAAPSVGIRASNTGLYSSAANTLDLTINGTQAHQWTSAGYGIKSDSATLYLGTAFDATIARAAAGSMTTDIWASLRPTQTIAGTGSITACKGHFILVSSAGTATLPAGTTVGQACTITSTTAAAVSVDVASASDTMILNGVALTAGNKASNDSSDESELYCLTRAANTWQCRSILGVWSDGGA